MARSSWRSWRTRPSAVGQFIIIHIVCKARSVVRIRGTGIVVRVRVRHTAIRVRAVVRPVHNTTLEEVCLIFYRGAERDPLLAFRLNRLEFVDVGDNDDVSPEGKARSAVRTRGTGIVARVRERHTAIRARAVARPAHNTICRTIAVEVVAVSRSL